MQYFVIVYRKFVVLLVFLIYNLGLSKFLLILPYCTAWMAPPRKNSENGLPSTEGTSDILQTIIQAIGGLTEVVQHQVGATNPMSALEKFRKLDPLSFKGSKDPLEVDNWLKELDRLFKAMNVRDGQRVTLAVFMLKGDALEWWESTKRTHEGGVISWQQFVDLF
jgi:hypothetical protein